MQLSIIIVNYNVKYFLEQCICSVAKAIAHLQAEVIVVDNQSSDESVAYLLQRFPWVQVIANPHNVGFGKANNQAAALAKGRYIVYLNPDTIVPEDCFEQCLHFFAQHPQCGGLGMRMVDGAGHFLPESKRAFPSPLTSLFKLMGLAALFPKSAIFNQYALGYLSEHDTHPVDVLAGAFMMLPANVCQATQGFDEAFFMYGEDIDLSYRIQQLGYQNYYLGSNTIIHFKGESTKKGSLNYVWMFYEAMIVFVRKHYTGKKAKTFTLLIQAAIVARALITIVKNLFGKVGLPFFDVSIVYLAIWGTEQGWIHWQRADMPFFQPQLPTILVGFSALYFATLVVTGVYDEIYKSTKTIASCTAAVVVLMAAYSLLPEPLRFSRGVVLIGGILAAALMLLLRRLLQQLQWIPNHRINNKKIVVIGNQDQYNYALQLLQNAQLHNFVIGRIAVGTQQEPNSIGNIHNLSQLLQVGQISDLVFCEGPTFSFQNIIQLIDANTGAAHFRIMSANSHCMVGSDSKATIGEAFTPEAWFNINQPFQKRRKRITDVVFALIAMLLFPLFVWRKHFSLRYFYHLGAIVWGAKSWIGYAQQQTNLPALKPAIFTHFGQPVYTKPFHYNNEALEKLDYLYATEYHWLLDVKLLIKQFPNWHKALCRKGVR
jgi:O-antigen biosynthesis protein